jgi:hypothetical protein
MSNRIKITLPDETAARLDEMAAASGEPVARVAGQMVRDALTKITAAARTNGTDPLDELPVARAPWLEPYGGDREWRQLTWGAIIALYGRYPEHLKGLKIGWGRTTRRSSCYAPSPTGARCSTTARPTRAKSWTSSSASSSSDDGSRKWAAVSPRSGNRAQPRTSGTDARQGTSGHRGARPYRLPRARRSIGATPAPGAVAAGWPPLRAPEASASPPCTCARPPPPALPQLVGRFAALGVINGCEDSHARTPTQPSGWALAAAR